MCNSMASKPMRNARFAELTKASRTRFMSASVASRGVCQLSPNGIAEAAIVSHGSSPALSALPPSHGRCAGIGQHALVHQVPVIGAAVVTGILAHRRDDDTACELEAGKPDRRKQGTAHEWTIPERAP